MNVVTDYTYICIKCKSILEYDTTKPLVCKFCYNRIFKKPRNNKIITIVAR